MSRTEEVTSMYRTKGYPVDLGTRRAWRERDRRGIRALLEQLFRRR